MQQTQTLVSNRPVASVIDGHGRPQNYLTFRILRLLFSPPFPPRRPSFTAKEIAALLAENDQEVEHTLHQLQHADLLTKPPSQLDHYQYNFFTCPHVDIQAALEKFILNAELEDLPIHLMFD